MYNVSIKAKEESALLEVGFEPLEDDRLLWEKNGVCYGRQAALQKACSALLEEEGFYLFDRRTRVSENGQHQKSGFREGFF